MAASEPLGAQQRHHEIDQEPDGHAGPENEVEHYLRPLHAFAEDDEAQAQAETGQS